MAFGVVGKGKKQPLCAKKCFAGPHYKTEPCSNGSKSRGTYSVVMYLFNQMCCNFCFWGMMLMLFILLKCNSLFFFSIQPRKSHNDSV